MYLLLCASAAELMSHVQIDREVSKYYILYGSIIGLLTVLFASVNGISTVVLRLTINLRLIGLHHPHTDIWLTNTSLFILLNGCYAEDKL